MTSAYNRRIYLFTSSNSQTMTSAYSPSTPCNRTKPVTSTAITTFIPVRQIIDVNCNHHIKVRNNDVSCTQPHLSQYVRNNDVNLQPPYLSQYVRNNDVSLQSPHFYPSTSAEKEEWNVTPTYGSRAHPSRSSDSPGCGHTSDFRQCSSSFDTWTLRVGTRDRLGTTRGGRDKVKQTKGTESLGTYRSSLVALVHDLTVLSPKVNGS